MPVGAVAAQLLGYQVELVVVSGGEPLSQQKRLIPLIDRLSGHGIEVEIETNGTRVPDERLVAADVRFNVSPKLSHSGDPASRRIVPRALHRLAELPTSTFKFVCRQPADLDEVGRLAQEFSLRSVWVMPEGRTSDEVSSHMQALVQDVIDRGWNITTRLHTLVWGDKRGV